MMFRLSSCFVPPITLARYVEHVKTVVIPAINHIPGLMFVWVLQRKLPSYTEVAIVTIWEQGHAGPCSLLPEERQLIENSFGAIAGDLRIYHFDD